MYVGILVRHLSDGLTATICTFPRQNWY